MWLRRHEPGIIRRAWKLLCFEEYALWRLGGPEAAATDYSIAGRTMFFDVRREQWSGELLKLAGLRLEQMPRALPSGTALCEVQPRLARRLGLPRGVLVATGGHDQPAGALGAGVIRPGLSLDSVGTVECLVISSDRPVLNRRMLRSNFCSYHHTAPGLYVTLAYNFTGASLMRWYRDALAQHEKELARRSGRDVYDVICSDLPEGPTGILVLPHFTTTGTPLFDPHSKGAILGLTLGTTKQELVKALMEGVSYEMALNIELLRKAGMSIREIRATGGGAKSPAWAQIKADIYGVPVAVPDSSEAASLGVALLAGVAAGEYRSVGEAVDAAVRIRRVFRPDPRRSREYAEHFGRYKEIYPRLAELLHRM
jgi:xylulokinase